MTQEFVTLPREMVEQAMNSLRLGVAMYPNGGTAGLTINEAINALSAALDQPQSEQPAMTPIAQRKLDSLLTEGYTISGYSIYNEQKHQHGFVTGAGLVGWWRPEGMEYPQPQGEQEPVATVNRLGTIYLTQAGCGMTPGTKLYTHQQPKRKPLTDEWIDAIADAMPGGLEGFMNRWGWRQFARAVLEATHNIK